VDINPSSAYPAVTEYGVSVYREKVQRNSRDGNAMIAYFFKKAKKKL
jgi:hypothetical protein